MSARYSSTDSLASCPLVAFVIMDIADVTTTAVGQNVATPNTIERK